MDQGKLARNEIGKKLMKINHAGLGNHVKPGGALILKQWKTKEGF